MTDLSTLTIEELQQLTSKEVFDDFASTLTIIDTSQYFSNVNEISDADLSTVCIQVCGKLGIDPATEIVSDIKSFLTDKEKLNFVNDDTYGFVPVWTKFRAEACRYLAMDQYQVLNPSEAGFQSTIDSLSSQFSDLSSQVSSGSSGSSSLATTVSNLQSQVNTISSNVNSLRSEVTSLENSSSGGGGGGGTTYTLPTASTTTLGGVKIDGSTITINNGVISVAGGGGGGGSGDLTTLSVSGQSTMDGFVDITYSNDPPTLSPIANPTVPTTAALSVHGTTNQGSANREWMGIFGLVSNQGQGSSADKVALYAGALGQAGSANLWAFNFVAQTSSPNHVLQGAEFDLNNLSHDASNDFTNSRFIQTLTGASSFPITAAQIFSEFNPRFYRGTWYTNNCVSLTSIIDSTNCFETFVDIGTHTNGLNLQGATYSNCALLLNPDINNGAIYWQGGGASVKDYTSSSGNRVVGFNAAAVFTSGSFLSPLVDNTTQLGDSAHRYAAVWATTGVVSTSDPRLKANIAPVPNTIDLVKKINPISFNWKEGGKDRVLVKKKELVPETETVIYKHHVHSIQGDKAYIDSDEKHVQHPIFDEFPVHDENDQPIFDEVTEKPHRTARMEPRMHKKARMVEKEVESYEYHSRPGKRTHYGFAADQVKQAFHDVGFGDFGGYVEDDGQMGLRHEQLLPILWQACQEMLTKIDGLEARLRNLEP